MHTKPVQIYLIPSTIAAGTQALVISPQIKQVIAEVDDYRVENVGTARRVISSLWIKNVSELHFELFDKHTPDHELIEFLSSLRKRRSVGVIS